MTGGGKEETEFRIFPGGADQPPLLYPVDTQFLPGNDKDSEFCLLSPVSSFQATSVARCGIGRCNEAGS